MAGIAASDFAHAVIAKYETGTQLGWHRDVPDFEDVVGVSCVDSAGCAFAVIRTRRVSSPLVL
jgi:hypothetical protein